MTLTWFTSLKIFVPFCI